MKSTLAAALAASILGAFSFGILAPDAEAVTPIGTASPISLPADSNLQLAATKVVKRKVVVKGPRKVVTRTVVVRKPARKVWVYNAARNGLRFRAKRPGYGYYYGGWWYPRPWWSICIGC